MKKRRSVPITGAKPEYGNNRKPIVPNAKDTSANEEQFIDRAPSPFNNDNTAATIPTGTAQGFAPMAGQQGTRAPMNPDGAAVGQARMPNQSAQIGGRNGFPPPKAKHGSVAVTSRKHARFYGER